MPRPLNVVVIGLSVTSSWGNGHATTYRSLLTGLAQLGHRTLFLEQDRPYYAAHRDLPAPLYCRVALYPDAAALAGFAPAIAAADLVIVGSYVADGAAVCRLVQAQATGVTAFYDIDTPVTLAALAAGGCDYLEAGVIPGFDLYLSFTGGPTLRHIEQHYGARAARALYCSAEPVGPVQSPLPPGGDCVRGPSGVQSLLPLGEEAVEPTPPYDLGYLGTYSADRQPAVERLLCQPARSWPAGRFAVFGPQYPAELAWPGNVQRAEHCPPDQHRAFYAAQRFTLNVTRADMVRAGFSPSVRLFEAAACATPVISDGWEGLDTLFTPGEEIIVASDGRDVLTALCEMPEAARQEMGRRAQARFLAAHTGRHRAAELVAYASEVRR